MAIRSLVACLLTVALAGCGASATVGSAASPLAGKLATRSAAAAAVKTENFTKVSDALYRGGYPELSDLKGLVALGVTTDISLMGGDSTFEDAAVLQEAKAARSLGMTFVNLRVPFKVAFPRAMADQFLSIVTQAEATTRGGHAVYLHCRHGRDRTGTMVAYYRIEHDGWTPARAIAEMETFGFKPGDYPTFVTFLTGLERAAS